MSEVLASDETALRLHLGRTLGWSEERRQAIEHGGVLVASGELLSGVAQGRGQR